MMTRLGSIGLSVSFAASALALMACSSSGDSTSANSGGASSSQSVTSVGNGATSSQTGSAAGGSGTGGGGGGVSHGLSKVGTGEYETLFLVDGVIYGYGGGAGLLGLGTYQGLAIPPRAIDTPMGLRFVDVQGGLHQSMAADENGHCWTWGDTSSGLSGSGTSGADGSVPYMITEDANGQPFDGVIAVEPTTSYNSALKKDGTVWVWGNCAGGITGDGTMSGVVEKPTRVPIPLPSGVKITKIVGASALLALASDGTVWAWGPTENPGYLGTGNSDQTVPRMITGVSKPMKDIAAGYSSFYYALASDGELFGWGYRGGYLGISGNNGYNPTPNPISLDSVLSLPSPIKSISADHMSTHVILADGSLWGWGDNAEGEVGDGHELDYSQMGYAWDFTTNLMVFKPVRIVPGVSNFKAIFSNSAYDFYDYALTDDGKLYSWGRNKTGTLGNGVYPLAANGNSGTSSNMSATYPNSWDVTLATEVSPMTVTPQGANSPACTANPQAKDCF